MDIRASSNMLSRALRIFDVIIKYFNRQAVPVVVENTHRCRDTHVIVFEEKVSFFLREPVRRSDHQLTKEDKEKLKRWSHAFIQKYDYHPSGCLTLEIDNYSAYGVKSRWTDGKKKRLENQLHEFICNVIKFADLKRTRRIEREKQDREWGVERHRQDELARLRQIELERREDLEKQAENWVKSRQLREYIQAVEIAASKQGISGPSHEGYAFWMRWAKAHADRLNPLTNGLPFKNETE